MLTVFHRTTKAAAEKILRDGFRDTTGRYLTDREWTAFGFPIARSTTVKVPVVTRIEIAEDVLAAFEWIEEGKPYREWLVPAAILNAGTVMLSEV